MILNGRAELKRLKFSKLKSSKAYLTLSFFYRKLKQDLQGGVGSSTTGFNDGLSVISETTGFGNATQFGRITHAEKNLNKLENNRAKELERVVKELEETREELAQVKTKHKAAVARRDTLEAQVKECKQEFQNKIKLLIDKTENDDKLI